MNSKNDQIKWIQTNGTQLNSGNGWSTWQTPDGVQYRITNDGKNVNFKIINGKKK